MRMVHTMPTPSPTKHLRTQLSVMRVMTDSRGSHGNLVQNGFMIPLVALTVQWTRPQFRCIFF